MTLCQGILSWTPIPRKGRDLKMTSKSYFNCIDTLFKILTNNKIETKLYLYFSDKDEITNELLKLRPCVKTTLPILKIWPKKRTRRNVNGPAMLAAQIKRPPAYHQRWLRLLRLKKQYEVILRALEKTKLCRLDWKYRKCEFWYCTELLSISKPNFQIWNFYDFLDICTDGVGVK